MTERRLPRHGRNHRPTGSDYAGAVHFDADNQGGYLYVQANDAVDLANIPEEALGEGGNWGIVFEDASGQGALFGSTTTTTIEAASQLILSVHNAITKLTMGSTGNVKLSLNSVSVTSFRITDLFDTTLFEVDSDGTITGAFKVTESGIILADVTTDNVTSTKHGFAPKSPADATKFLNGAATPAYAQVKDSDLSTSDITSNNSSSTKHGFAPKSPADATQFLNGAATPAYAQVKDSDLSTSDITTNNVSTTKHGFAPKLPNDATKYLDGTGAYSTPSGGTGTSQHILLADGHATPFTFNDCLQMDDGSDFMWND